jgi:TrpR-related protein YerC/YecD
MSSYPAKADKELITAFGKLKNEQETAAFLRDLLTPAEIDEFSRRFQIAKLLWMTNLSYAVIAEKADTSTTTVTRVAQWLYKERWHGYSAVLQRLFGQSKR